MLTKLHVRNFAIIEDLTLSFDKGMTVLTGETGAGKSLIIDAISLLLGDKASGMMVRYGSNCAIIEGEWIDMSDTAMALLGLKHNTCIIKRVIESNGKSSAFLDEKVINAAKLSKVAPYLCDIHNQFAFESMLEPKNYLGLLDTHLDLLKDYQESYKDYVKKEKAYRTFKEKNKLDNERIDYLKYQIKELDSLKLSSAEETQLKEQASLYNHAESMQKNLENICNDFNEHALNDLYDAIKELDDLMAFDSSFKELKERLENDYYDLDDLRETLEKKYHKSNDLSELDIDEINDRLGVYADTKRKYNKNIPDILTYLESLQAELSNSENYDNLVASLEEEYQRALNHTFELGQKLHDARVQESLNLALNLQNELKELELNHVEFKVAFKDISTEKLFNNGLDQVDFLISFNAGMPLAPLNKVASGGELSRFMLALKSVVKDRLLPQTMIFDEIDQGVSGQVAQAIALKMRHISESCQVFAVTHLPQVAAIAAHQVFVSKKQKNNNTFISADELTYKERVNAIACMISSGEATEAAKVVASELLNQ